MTAVPYVIHADSAIDREAVIKAIHQLPSDKAWVVTIKRQSRLRSLNQNDLFHSWVGIIAESTGNDVDDVKATLKDMFLPLQVVSVGKVSRMVRPSTAKLSVGEMSQFMEKVMAFAATDLGITLPSTETL